jgi:inner membrane protein
MDNLSHSAAGLLAGEIVHRSLPAEVGEQQQRLRRRLLLATCALAGNFPDLDLVLTPLLPAPLGYLLHHRGHTHTILYALPQMLMLAALLWLFWPNARRLLRQSATARFGFMLALVAGFALHLLMDYLNSYGLHPFHPVDSNWVYGDMVFILEPVFWVAFGIPMAMTLRRGATRWLLLAAAPLVLGYFGWRGFLAWQSLAALLALMLGLMAAGRRSHDGRPRLSGLRRHPGSDLAPGAAAGRRYAEGIRPRGGAAGCGDVPLSVQSGLLEFRGDRKPQRPGQLPAEPGHSEPGPGADAGVGLSPGLSGKSAPGRRRGRRRAACAAGPRTGAPAATGARRLLFPRLDALCPHALAGAGQRLRCALCHQPARQFLHA